MFDTMLHRDIRQTLDEFRHSVDQLLSSSPFSNGTDRTAHLAHTFAPAVEYFWSNDQVLVRAVIPGVAENEVNVTVQNGELIIDGERKAPEGWGENARTQIAYGKFHAVIPVPNGLELDQVSCWLHDGVLDIQIPRAEQMKPRHIPIGSDKAFKSITASA